MTSRSSGLITGLLLGIAHIEKGFGSMLIVGLAGLVGWLVGKVLGGELDVNDYLSGERFRRQRGRR